MRALRHPALGLALVMVGIAPLVTQLMSIASAWLFDYNVPFRMLAPLLLMATVSALQVATGVAITRQRFAGIAFGAWVLAGCAFTIVTATLTRDGTPFTPAFGLGAAVEIFGLPVLIAIASLRYANELEDTRTFSDVSAALFIIALHTFVMTPLSVAGTIRMTQGAELDLGSWASILMWPAATLVLGVFAALGTRSRPMARLYIYIDVAVILTFSALTVGWTLVEDDHEMVHRVVIASRIISLVGFVLVASLWLYLRSLASDGKGSRVPMWTALTYVPTLLGRLILSDEVAYELLHTPMTWVIAIAAGLAIVLLALADASLRDRPAARAWAIAAAVIALALLVTGAIYIFGLDPDRLGRGVNIGLLAPLGYLIASTIGAAVYSRR